MNPKTQAQSSETTASRRDAILARFVARARRTAEAVSHGTLVIV
jgi:hypothetical protein